MIKSCWSNFLIESIPKMGNFGLDTAVYTVMVFIFFHKLRVQKFTLVITLEGPIIKSDYVSSHAPLSLSLEN